jgi:hypothetical protein
MVRPVQYAQQDSENDSGDGKVTEFHLNQPVQKFADTEL